MTLCALRGFPLQIRLSEASLCVCMWCVCVCVCVCACPAWPGTPASLLSQLSPDVAEPLSGLTGCPASSASSGKMKASHSFAVGVGTLAAA